MTKRFFITLFILCLNFSMQAQVQKLTIYFNGLSSNNGKIMVLVQDSLEKDASKLVLNINKLSSKVDIYLPRGKYGVIAFHDKNGNEKLDTNVLGVPTEPYGFSNNVRGFLSKPDFEETLVDLNKDLSITFKLE